MGRFEILLHVFDNHVDIHKLILRFLYILLGSCYNVYIGVTKPPQDFVHQDGRRLAHIQSYDSLFRGEKDIVKLS